MTSKISNITAASFVALCVALPLGAQAQSLAVTCDGGTGGNECVQSDINEIVAGVNQNATDIDANTAAAGNAQTAANNAQTAANNAQFTADGAVAVNVTQQAEIAANASDITALDGRVTTNEEDIADLDGRVGDNEEDIVDLDRRVTTNEEDIADIDDRVTTNEGAIATNTTNIQTNTNAIAANTSSIQTNAGNIAANSEAIAANASDIVDLQDGLADLRSDLNQGLAMANAMEVFAPDPGSNFRLNIGTGFHDSEAAFGITASGRVGDSGGTIVYLGVAASQDVAAGKAGVSFQW